MDEVDTQQQKEIEALQNVDVEHWQELMELGYKTMWVQRTFSLVFVWLFIITIILGMLLFHKYTLEVNLVPH